jgi:hypothetical protein
VRAQNLIFTLTNQQLLQHFHLLAIVKHYFEENIQEKFMFCPPLPQMDVLVMNGYFTADDTSWANCIDISAEEAANLAGQEKGLRDELFQIAPCAKYIHSLLLEGAITMNVAESRQLHSRIFVILGEKIQAGQKFLSLQPEVRWLSSGKVS